MSITLTQLSTFAAVARTGSVGAAAAQLVVTQPSVSAALAALSRELGLGLTERVGRSIRLTPAGEAFAPYAADVLGLLEQGRRAAHEAVAAAAREIRIAAVTTAAEYLVPPLVRSFVDLHPETRVSLEAGNRKSVLARLVDRSADLAIGGRPPPDMGLIGLPFLRNELVLIVPPDDGLALRGRVELAELEERTWLLREEGSGTRALIEDWLAQCELRPRTLTLGSNGAIKHAVRMGLGISLQSRIAVELEVEAGVLAALHPPRLPARDWYLLRPASGPVRPTVESFLAFALGERARAAIQEARRPIAAPVDPGAASPRSTPR